MIPTRFESLYQAFGGQIRPLIVPIDEDLAALTYLRERGRVQNSGLIVFMLGRSGIGKTTAVYSASVNMPEVFQPVVAVPPPTELSLRDAATWLRINVPAAVAGRTTLVLFDGREVSDDEVGLRQFISGLNQFVRQRGDVLFCWPTTDSDWHHQIRNIAETVGGANLAPSESDYEVQGPPAGEWPQVLERLLLQYTKTYADIGVGSDLILQLCTQSNTVGDFLGRVSAIIAQRISDIQVTKQLPRLLFIITSSGDVVGEANRIRRAGNQILAPEPLLAYSPRSEAGQWWAERNRDPNHHLGYMISLFEARLVTMRASAVVYACLHHGEEDLKQAALNAGARANTGNAGRVIVTTDLYRFLTGETIPEFTTGQKGNVQQSTINAYSAIQGLSAQRHKAINQACCGLVREHLDTLEFTDDDFEVAHEQQVVTDAVVAMGTSGDYYLEFHHLSEAHCRGASMASYIMDKIRRYSIYHQLIPR